MVTDLMEIRPILLGHRGARGKKGTAENTLAAFDFALAQGCDGFEFDVRLAADREAVISHDATTSARGLRIAEFSSQQLNLPRLEEVLTRYQHTAFLDIELKVPGLERITVELLQKAPPTRGLVVSSFLPEVLETLRDLDANIPLGLICESQAQLNRWRQLPVEYVFPHHKLARKKLISEIKDGGRKIFVWTVNIPASMKRFSEWGVDGIISDNPKRLAITLGRRIEKR